MKMTLSTTQQLTQSILEHPHEREWSLQGLGMLRTYLDPEKTVRLHVWTEAGANEGVSELHTHPWDFSSVVIAGEVLNQRFARKGEVPASAPANIGAQKWQQQTIRCGEGGGLEGDPEEILLFALKAEHYPSGTRYRQSACEIHRSKPADGTVSIITRTFGADTEHAYVYFPVGQEWVSAEPRAATFDEVGRICKNALEKWF
jgi:hypothetical protein